MTPPPDPSTLSPAEKDALIAALVARIDALMQEVEALRAEISALRAKLGEPPKTPGNSSMPPSQGHKAGGTPGRSAKSKAHGGAHRPLHPNPTRRRDVLAERCPHCRADVRGAAQAPMHAYDRIEIPEIIPDVTRVMLHGGVCPCCGGRFKAAPPAGLEPGSPFGPNLRAFVLYLRFTHAVSFERLARLLGALISGGVPLLEALRLAGQGAENPLLQAAMWDAIPHVAGGETLAASFGHAGILPPAFCAQVGGAEATGDLPDALRRLAEWHAARVDYLSARAAALLEPLLILVLALLAGWITLGVFMPLVGVIQSLSGVGD